MGPVGLHGRGVVDRIRTSGDGESLGGGENSSAWVYFGDVAVPDWSKFSRACAGAEGRTNSDDGAGAVISRALAAQFQFVGRVQFEFP